MSEIQTIDARILELKKQRQQVYAKQWRLRNLAYVKKRDSLHTMKYNRLKSIKDLKKRIKKYELSIPKIDAELDKISRNRPPNIRNSHEFKNKVKKVD